MCGIVGYVGKRPVLPLLLDGLTRLEYRGYDSAGVAWIEENSVGRLKSEGRLENLTKLIKSIPPPTTTTGIGHTRWATHGEPTSANAHPHVDCKGEIAVVHNGIIENYRSIKQQLIIEGHHFSSETDTEVLAHLIEKYLKNDLLEAVRSALLEVEGSFAVTVMWQKSPELLVAAKRHSPLVIGIASNGEQEGFVASDVPALLAYTKEFVFLEDDEMAIITPKGACFFELASGGELKKEATIISWDADMAQRGGYPHFMLKEIYEQPQAVVNTARGRLIPEDGSILCGELAKLNAFLKENVKKIVILACGTSWHAGLIARYWLEKWCGFAVEVELASEFRYREYPVDKNTLVIPISQSGETADTLEAMKLAKKQGATIVAICNVLGSAIYRGADATILTHAGPEIGVASTKAFTSQLTALYCLGLYLSQLNNTITLKKRKQLIHALLDAAVELEKWLPVWHEKARLISDVLYDRRDFLYLGRNLQYPIALEGALKLKEISYIHAEGYAAGEMKHGPIAMIDKNMPLVAICPKDHVYEKMLSNIQEARARKGIIVAIGEETDRELIQTAHFFIPIPKLADYDCAPIITVTPLQLLAYEIAVARGCDVDKPRNLAKSVTVE